MFCKKISKIPGSVAEVERMYPLESDVVLNPHVPNYQ